MSPPPAAHPFPLVSPSNPSDMSQRDNTSRQFFWQWYMAAPRGVSGRGGRGRGGFAGLLVAGPRLQPPRPFATRFSLGSARSQRCHHPPHPRNCCQVLSRSERSCTGFPGHPHPQYPTVTRGWRRGVVNVFCTPVSVVVDVAPSMSVSVAVLTWACRSSHHPSAVLPLLQSIGVTS